MAEPYITSDDAFMAGSATNYWSDTRLVMKDETVDILDQEVKAVKIRVQDENKDPRYHNKRFTLTLDDLNQAARKMLNEKLAASYTLGYIAQRDIDNPTLDVVIQIACFGKVVYG